MPEILSPNSRLLLLGRGKLYWGAYLNNAVGSFADLGNVTELTFGPKPTIEKVFNMQGGVAGLYDQGVSQLEMELTIKGDEFSANALTIIFGGTKVPFSQTGATITAETVTTNLHLGGIYFLAKQDVTTLTDLKIGATSLVLDVPGTPGDYHVLDALNGVVQILQTPATGAVIEGATLTADYITGTVAYDQVSPGTNPLIDGQLYFVGNNARGINRTARFWHVSIAADQGPSLIGDKYATWNAKAGVLNDWVGSAGAHGGSANFPYCSLQNTQAS